MARAIIRTSINGPSPNTKQGQLRKLLEAAGFDRIGTGAYEGDFRTEADALDGVQVALEYLANLRSPFHIDHLWVYVDEVDHP